MKKIIIALGIAFAMMSCGASKSTSYINKYTDEVLDGVFQLRLGMSEEELRAVVDTSQIYDKEHFADNKHAVTYHKGRLKRLSIREYIPTSRGYNTPISKYKMKNISVRFLDNKIYYIEFSVDGDSMKDILISKYGKPKVKSSTIKSKGQYTVVNPAYKETTHQYGDTYKTVEYPESSSIKEYTYKKKYKDYSWKTNNEDISFTSKQSRYRNNSWYYTIENKRIKNEIISVSYKENQEYTKGTGTTIVQDILGLGEDTWDWGDNWEASMKKLEKKKADAEKAAKAKIIEDL